jgi:DTW domain-containing protein YfiP
MSTAAQPRATCLRCFRPEGYCYCDRIVPVQTGTKLVFLQHPREARVAVGTARMAHLGLPGSELHEGVSFEAHPRMQELCAEPGTWLLFPGEGAHDPSTLVAGTVEKLVVIDGTWPQARKLLRMNPSLAKLPRLGLVPRKPGNYRIRKEPAADCLATIEAVVELLGVLERDPARFDAMLAAFEWMVDRQLEEVAKRDGTGRTKRPRQRAPKPEDALFDAPERVVVLHAEVNAHARGSDAEGTPELVHLVARRLGTGEAFESVMAPRRPLAPSAPFHLGLDEARMRGGESVEAARARWDAFRRPDDVVCCWGPFPIAKLDEESFTHGETVDLRWVMARRTKGKPGSPAEACSRSGGLPSQEAARAQRVVGDLAVVAEGMHREGRRRGSPAAPLAFEDGPR